MHASLADVLLDLVQNSIEAGAGSIRVVLEENPERIVLEVADDGKGMDAETSRRALDPFWTDGEKHPGRRVGLGLPFLRQTADQCGGSMLLESAPGEGTRVEARFPADNVDLPPLGDVAGLWLQCLMFEGGHGMAIRRTKGATDGNGASYEIDRRDIAEALGTLEDAGALALLRDYLASLEDGLNE